MKKVRIIIGIILCIIIIVMGIYTYVNREKFFQNRATIQYPNGCVEVYINNELTGEECITGRQMVEDAHQNPIRSNYSTIQVFKYFQV